MAASRMSPTVICSRPERPATRCNSARLWRTPLRDKLSYTWTLASVFSNKCRTQLEPIKPAPPKTRTELNDCDFFMLVLLVLVTLARASDESDPGTQFQAARP